MDGAEQMQLASVIDQIWRAPDERRMLAMASRDKLSANDWLVLIAWDAAATLGPANGRLELLPPDRAEIRDNWGKSFLRMSVQRSQVQVGTQCLIAYQGTDYCVMLDSGSQYGVGGGIVHDATALLVSLQIIRDHLDTSLLKPAMLRDADLMRFASIAGVDQDQFRRLASWFPAIAKYADPGEAVYASSPRGT
jgi:hypothetical protein